MKKIQFALFSLLLLAAACGTEPADQQQSEEGGLTADQVYLACQPMNNPDADEVGAKHEVYLYLADSKVKIADVITCDVIEADSYEQFQIPKEAIMAVGGWYAGFGDYFYLIMEGDNFVVKQGDMDEEREENNYYYKTVATYSKAGKEVL